MALGGTAALIANSIGKGAASLGVIPSAAGAVTGAGLVANVLEENLDPDRQFGEVDAFIAQQLDQARQQLRVRRLMSGMRNNAARLAAVAPDLYNSLNAGEEVPEGSFIIGQPPRNNALAEIALRMAQGEQFDQGMSQ